MNDESKRAMAIHRAILGYARATAALTELRPTDAEWGGANQLVDMILNPGSMSVDQAFASQLLLRPAVDEQMVPLLKGRPYNGMVSGTYQTGDQLLTFAELEVADDGTHNYTMRTTTGRMLAELGGVMDVHAFDFRAIGDQENTPVLTLKKAVRHMVSQIAHEEDARVLGRIPDVEVRDNEETAE